MPNIFVIGIRHGVSQAVIVKAFVSNAPTFGGGGYPTRTQVQIQPYRRIGLKNHVTNICPYDVSEVLIVILQEVQHRNKTPLRQEVGIVNSLDSEIYEFEAEALEKISGLLRHLIYEHHLTTGEA